MKRYRSHKVVEAERIASIDHEEIPGGSTHIRLEDGQALEIAHRDSAPFQRALPGWYFVRYDHGYVSASPPDQFEQGYTEIADSAHGPSGANSPRAIEGTEARSVRKPAGTVKRRPSGSVKVSRASVS